jgi:class 3 adenylate cyclase
MPEVTPARVSRLRPWHRLGWRLGALFAVVTLLATGIAGAVFYDRQRRQTEELLGVQLLNTVRTAVLLIDPAAHARVQASSRKDTPEYRVVEKAVADVRRQGELETPVYTLADFDRARRQARLIVVSGEGRGVAGDAYPVAPEVLDPLAWTFEDGFARTTMIYRDARGTWMTGFAPILDAAGKTTAVLVVDYPLGFYLDRLDDVRAAVVKSVALGTGGAFLVGLLFAQWLLARPIGALTRGVARVAGGDLSQTLPVRSRDEVGRLTQAFNQMLDGLRQRDFIRDTFGRYVSPEVAKELLESPDGLRLGGEKRVITVLMSDLRGYTRFAEQGDPAWVMEVLNGFLARMTDIVVAHGGTINEFIGDAIFAVFGAPLPHPDHAERAAATALAMQRAMADVNREHAARGLPRFEMGIGLNTGEAVVGNIGSQQRAKYAVVGSAVNVAARVEGATVGGQIFLSAATWDQVRELVDVAAPVPVAVKGLAEPLLLYELRGIGGRFAQRLDESSTETDPRAETSLPLTCWVIDGKVVRGESLDGVVVRLGPREIAVRMAEPLATLTNVKLRLSFVGLGHDSGDLYGKVVGEQMHDGTPVTRIRLTSVDPVDQKVIEDYLAG